MNVQKMLKNASPVWGLLFVVAVLFSLSLIPSQQGAQAAPPAIPTPASVNYSAENTAGPVFFFNGEVITQTVASTGFILGQAEALDIQHVIDQTAGNGVTVTLQYSNDGSNWFNGVTIITNNTADANDGNQYNNFFYRTRLRAVVDASDTDPVTLTISALARR